MALDTRARLRYIAIVAALIGLSPAALTAQRSVRIRWPLIDWVVRGDSGRPLMFVMSTNLLGRSDPSARSPDWVLFDPRVALQWTAALRHRVNPPQPSSGSPVTPLGPTLWGLAGDRFLAVAVNPGANASEQFLVLLTDTTGKRGYRVAASLRDLHALLDGVDAISAWVVNPDSAAPPRREGESPSCPAEAQHLDQPPLDVEPEYLGGRPPVYPPREREAELSGRVLLEVLVDSLGRVDHSATCVILTDGAAFTESALAMIRYARFKPGERAGQPVTALGIMPVEYRIRSRR